MEVVVAAIISVTASAVTGYFAWRADKSTGQAQSEVAQIEAQSNVVTTELQERGAEWQAMFDELKEWSREQLTIRDQSLGLLEQKIEIVRGQLEEIQLRYMAAIDHIKDYRLAYPDSLLVPPDKIRADLEKD